MDIKFSYKIPTDAQLEHLKTMLFAKTGGSPLVAAEDMILANQLDLNRYLADMGYPPDIADKLVLFYDKGRLYRNEYLRTFFVRERKEWIRKHQNILKLQIESYIVNDTLSPEFDAFMQSNTELVYLIQSEMGWDLSGVFDSF